MKKIITRVALAAVFAAPFILVVALPAEAASPWNINGNWVVTFTYPGLTIAPHDMTVNGNTATGGQPAGGSYEEVWTATVTLSGGNVKIQGTYQAGSTVLPYSFTAKGTVAYGSMSGTWTDSQGRSGGTWSAKPSCTPIDGVTLDGTVPVTAGIVATSSESITGELAASGCGVGVYVGPGVTGVTVSSKINGDVLAGVYVHGGSADVTSSVISNIGNTPLDGVQYGWGVLYDDGATGNISWNKISAYQKAGVKVLGASTSVNIAGNTVTGEGPISYIAQNGIEVVSGATASITNNAVTGNSYQGGTSSCADEDYFGPGCTQSGGILLFDALPSTSVSGNNVSTNDVGIWTYSDSAVGPYLVNDNESQNNYGYGIVFDSVNGTSTNDLIKGNPVGLLVTDESQNASVTSLGDRFANDIVNNEAISATTTFYEDLVVETTGSPFHLPPIGPHGLKVSLHSSD
jgi:Right handed beta helix region